MALPDSAKYVDGTSFIFAFDTDWPASPTQGWSATVDAEIDMGGLANGAYRQSAKCDLTVNRDVEYKVEVSVETEADATAGGTIDVYYYTSDSATVGTGNMGGCSGADAAYTGGTGGTAATGIKLLEYAGPLVLQATAAADAEPQIGVVGMIRPAGRYLGIVVGNNSGTALATTADELAIRVTGQNLQLQD